MGCLGRGCALAKDFLLALVLKEIIALFIGVLVYGAVLVVVRSIDRYRMKTSQSYVLGNRRVGGKRNE